MKDLTLSESVLLLAIWRLKNNAYGVKIRKHIAEVTGRLYSYGTLYSSLDQLVRKRYVYKTVGDPTPQRGGRSKIYYKLTPDAVASLQAARDIHKTILEGIEDIAFESGE